MYYFGTGVKKSLKKARKYFGKAAAQGDDKGQYNKGEMMIKGDGGEKNIVEGIILMDKAVKQGNEDAIEYMDALSEMKGRGDLW